MTTFRANGSTFIVFSEGILDRFRVSEKEQGRIHNDWFGTWGMPLFPNPDPTLEGVVLIPEYSDHYKAP